MIKTITPIFLFIANYCFCQSIEELNIKNSPSNFAQNITEEPLRRYLYTLATDGMEGRETASLGEQKAASYIAKQFESMGLQPGAKGGWEQVFKFYKDSVTKATLRIGKSDCILGKDFSYNSYGIEKIYNQLLESKEIVFAGFGISNKKYDSYGNLNIKGKIVLILDEHPTETDSNSFISGSISSSTISINEKIAIATRKGAKMVLIVNNDRTLKVITKDGRISRKSKEYILNNKSKKPILNYFFITDKIAESILGEPLSGIREQLQKNPPANKIIRKYLRLQFEKVRLETGITSRNVVALLEGSDKKNEYLIVSAHFDHKGKNIAGKVYYGADDNASGTSAIMAIAGAFSNARRAGYGPRRSILFIAFSAEEIGLLGSNYYVDNPIYPLKNTIANLNIDMLGRIGEDYIYDKDSLNHVFVFGSECFNKGLKLIIEKLNNNFTKLKLDFTDKARYFERSDQYSFAKQNIPAIIYTNCLHEDYHKITDTPDKINYNLLAKRAQLVFYTAWEIANREKRL